jgi:hypothetical protein
MPSNIKSIWGSNDDVNWTKITTAPTREEATSNVAGLAFGYDDRLEFKNLDNPNYYKYHAIVADAFTRLKDVKLFGIRNQGSSTLHDGTLTLTKKVTAPQLESTGIINMKGDYTEIRANSNVVTEFNRSKKLIRYPRVYLLTGQSGLGSGYTQDGYTVKASGEYNNSSFYAASRAFSGSDDTWITPNNAYSGSTGLPVANSANTTKFGQNGSWLEIKLPNTIQLSSTRIFSRPDAPTERTDTADIWASNTGNDGDWVKLTTINFNDVYTDAIPMVADIDTQAYYQYFAIQITKIGWTGGTYGNIGEWELFGVPEYDPEAHGTDVVVKSVPNVPNTDWLEVYYDGQDYSIMPATVTDKSGNNITATANNITIDATYNSFEFTQSPKSNIIADNVTFVSGDEPHSIALWVRLKNGNANNLLFDYRVAGGTSVTGAATGLYILNSNKRLQFYHQGTDKVIDLDFEQNRWYHIVGTYGGGGGFTGSKIYIDGVDVGGVISGPDSVLVLPTTGTITIGDYLYGGIGLGDGSIANVRLFNRALTSDEIWQLYAYQKEYFGHGDLGMTLKAGRLGIGTSEPRAALDVRGGFQCGNSPLKFFVLTGVHPNPIEGQNVTLPDGLNGTRLVSITGVTVNTNGDTVPFERHSESSAWEVDVYYNIATNLFHLSSQGSGCPGKEWRMFVVTT